MLQIVLSGEFLTPNGKKAGDVASEMRMGMVLNSKNY